MLDQFGDLENVAVSATFLLTIFTAGVAGSIHCAGMCGPLAHLVSQSIKQNLSYNFGRLVGYSVLGATLGALGELLFDSDLTWLKLMGVSLTSLFIIFSIISVLTKKHISFFLPQVFSVRLFKLAQSKGQIAKGFYLGLLTTILPCGWLMTFGGIAAASGSALSGTTIMIVFWLSTLAVMTIIPLNAQRFMSPIKKKSPMVAGILIAASSIFVIGYRFYSKHSCH